MYNAVSILSILLCKCLTMKYLFFSYQTHPISLHFHQRNQMIAEMTDLLVGGIQRLSVFWSFCLKCMALYLYGVVEVNPLVLILI